MTPDLTAPLAPTAAHPAVDPAGPAVRPASASSPDPTIPGGDEPASPAVAYTGVWRVLSFAIVVATGLIAGIWILQSQSASDIAVTNSRTLDVTVAEVAIDGLPVPASARVTVLGFDGRLGEEVINDAAQLEVPSRVPALVALLDERSRIHGLSIVSRPTERVPVRISASTTAHALLVLSPALLEADIERARQKVDDIQLGDPDPAVLALEEAIASNPIISEENLAVEQALGAVLDRMPVRPQVDQGCDSTNNPQAIAAAGGCAEPIGDHVTFENHQDRWVIVFKGPEPFTQPCAAVAPENSPGQRQSLAATQCGPTALLAAPGPIVDRSADRQTTNRRIEAAVAVDLFARYIAPLTDMTGHAAGLNRASNSHMLTSYPEIVRVSADLIETSPGFAEALDVTVASATPIERHASTLAATRSLLGRSHTLIDGWNGNAPSLYALLDFYDRVGDQMFDDVRTDWRWTADAWGVIPLEVR